MFKRIRTSATYRENILHFRKIHTGSSHQYHHSYSSFVLVIFLTTNNNDHHKRESNEFWYEKMLTKHIALSYLCSETMTLSRKFFFIHCHSIFFFVITYFALFDLAYGDSDDFGYFVCKLWLKMVLGMHMCSADISCKIIKVNTWKMGKNLNIWINFAMGKIATSNKSC